MVNRIRPRASIGLAAAAALVLSLAVDAGRPAQAADENGVARMHACAPATSNFVSLEVAPEEEAVVPAACGWPQTPVNKQARNNTQHPVRARRFG